MEGGGTPEGPRGHVKGEGELKGKIKGKYICILKICVA